MRVPAFPGVAVILAGMIGLAGCSNSAMLEQQADVTCQRLMGEEAGKARPVAGVEASEARRSADDGGATVGPTYAGSAMPLALAAAPSLSLCVATPSDVEAGLPAAVATGTAAAGEDKKGEDKKAADIYPSLEGKSAGDIFKDDLQAFPGRLWNGTKLSYGNWPNMAMLSLAFGGSMIMQNNLDKRVEDHMELHHTSLHQLGPWGANLGHPATHIGAALVWYGWTVVEKDAKNHELALVLIEALTINDLSTGLLQVSVNQHDPRGNYYGWPSGHTSSSFTVASVLHEYYGWKVGIPAYVVATYVGASRIEDRRHNVSDVWFGASMGLLIGHSVARGELPQIGGFTVLPFSRDDANGLMLMKQW